MLGLVAMAIAVGSFGVRPGAAAATPLPAGTSFGVNVKVRYLNQQYQPANLSTAYASGVRVVRTEATQGENMDGIVTWLAKSHLSLYPILGLPCPPGTQNCNLQTQIPPDTAAREMASYIAAFAKRYGSNGTFWSANPSLPYLPVGSFEIGNEPNLRVIWVQDGTHLHWDEPGHPAIPDYAAYAKVYEASRTALHNADPTGVAVVGGLADSARGGVDVPSDEAALSALPPGAADAVGFHPWVFDVSNSLLQPDTTDLRTWMDAHGFSAVPLDVNEFGACQTTSKTIDNHYCSTSQSSATWGSAVASYTKWAVCTPWANVRNLQPFVWGATPVTDQDVWLPLFASNGTKTAYGEDFLSQTSSLTSAGCPSPAPSDSAPVHTSPPVIQGLPVSGKQLSASPGTWSGQPTPTLTYQWQRCDPNGSQCSMIAGANSTTYTVQDADVGTTFVLLVTASNTAGGATASSTPTGRVLAAGSSPPAGGDTPSGTPTGQVLPAGSSSQVVSMALRIVRFTKRGDRVSLTVHQARESGVITVTVARQGRKRRARRLRGRTLSASTVTFSARLSAGRWIVTVAGRPASGFAKPRPTRRMARIAKH